jgi:hypothetical protein
MTLASVKAALAAAIAWMKPKLSALASAKCALPAGIAIGYLGHPVIKLAIDAIKGLLGLVKHL